MDGGAAYEARYEVTAGTVTVTVVTAVVALGSLGFVLASRLDEDVAEATGGLLGILVIGLTAATPPSGRCARTGGPPASRTAVTGGGKAQVRRPAVDGITCLVGRR
jgi:hypothetical protein